MFKAEFGGGTRAVIITEGAGLPEGATHVGTVTLTAYNFGEVSGLIVDGRDPDGTPTEDLNTATAIMGAVAVMATKVKQDRTLAEVTIPDDLSAIDGL